MINGDDGTVKVRNAKVPRAPFTGSHTKRRLIRGGWPCDERRAQRIFETRGLKISNPLISLDASAITCGRTSRFDKGTAKLVIERLVVSRIGFEP